MQRLIIEGPLDKFGKLDGETLSVPIRKLKHLETLHLLRADQEEFASICRIRLEKSDDSIEDIFKGDSFEITPLINEDPGTYICFIRERRPERAKYLMNSGVYFPGPYEIRDGRVKFGVMGQPRQLREFINGVKKIIPEFNVVSVTNGEFFTGSPLETLTEKQREVLAIAFESGYYDIPRKATSKELAGRADLDSSTFIEHRRKAEQRLMRSIFSS